MKDLITHNLIHDIDQMKSAISDLYPKIDELQQYSRKKGPDITRIPYLCEKQKDTDQIALNICNKQNISRCWESTFS